MSGISSSYLFVKRGGKLLLGELESGSQLPHSKVRAPVGPGC
jgi:hypothetical protein